MKTIKVKLTLLEEMLGMSPASPDIYDKFIATKAPNDEAKIEELSNIPLSQEEMGMTVFPRNEEDEPILYDYQIKGFFKDTCGMLRRVPKTLSSKVKAYKKEIDGLIFVGPREIKINIAGDMGTCQRPLRAATPQGERVALASSETVPAGSTLEFEIMCMLDDQINLVLEWLEYGVFRGLGQWRNSGKGKFEFEVIE